MKTDKDDGYNVWPGFGHVEPLFGADCREELIGTS